MALYRKYRPQTIGELDKKHVRSRLTAMAKSGEFPHALLFSGPRGTGKTSTARIVAKVLNCTGKKSGKKLSYEPCTACVSCKAIVDGAHVDVSEIDAASNRGIDEIRDLREKIHLAPAMGGVKIYIIDEVHMLTREAFNALLKTLEEPPVHAYFILATTEEHKLPDTIVSRCTKILFSKATDDELLHSLERVVKGEKLTVDEDILRLIAQHAAGSFRDATKLLEQAALEAKLTSREDVAALIGASSSIPVLLQLLLQKDAKEALEYVGDQEGAGVDVQILIAGLLDEAHSILLRKHGIERGDSIEAENDIPVSEIMRLVRLLTRAYSETKTSYIETLPLELAVIEYCGSVTGNERR